VGGDGAREPRDLADDGVAEEGGLGDRAEAPSRRGREMRGPDSGIRSSPATSKRWETSPTRNRASDRKIR